MKIYLYMTIIFCLTLGRCLAEREWPNTYYFKGIEDRLEQADIVVIGEAWLRGNEPDVKEVTCPARIELKVKVVVKGEQVPKNITYDVVYNLYTLSSQEKPDTPIFSKEDKLAFHMSKTVAFWEFNKPENVVVLLKGKESQLSPWRVYWNTFHEGCTTSLPRIYQAEQTRKKSGSLTDIYALLSPEESIMIRQYAVRTILKSDQPWAEICEMLSAHIEALDAPYSAGAIAAHSRVRQLKEDDLNISEELLNSVIFKTTNEKERLEISARIKQNCPVLSSRLSTQQEETD